jgi:hypothetical protein
MDKHIRRTVAMIITETWTITWADGEQISVTYRFRQHGEVIADGLMQPGQRSMRAGKEVQDTAVSDAPECGCEGACLNH